MKKLNILIAVLFLSIQIKAQVFKDIEIPIANVNDFLINPIDDAKTLIEGYVEPLGKAIGTGLNAGWYNTGKPHRFPGFDITLGLNIISLPDESKVFSALLPSGLQVEDLPTISGAENLTELHPGGGGFNKFPIPYMQGSVGLIYKTELLFRYMPTYTRFNLESNYWGFGIKHDFKQHVPVVGKLPFDLSFLAAYSNFTTNYHYDDNKKNLDFDTQAFNCNMILSKKLAFITTYAGAGYQYSKSNLAFNGSWELTNPEGSMYSQEDPINLSVGGINGFKTNIGARLKFLLFTVHADYTMAEYNIFTIGIGLNSDIGSRIIGGTLEKATKKTTKKEKGQN